MMVSATLEGLWMASDAIVDSRFFVKFHRSGPAIIFSSWTDYRLCKLSIYKSPKQSFMTYQDLIKMVSVILEGLRIVSDRIIDFLFSSNFIGPDLQ